MAVGAGLDTQQLLDLAQKKLAEGKPKMRLSQQTRDGDVVGGIMRWPGNRKGTIVRVQDGRTVVEWSPETIISYAQAKLYGERVKAERAARVKHQWDTLPEGTFPAGFDKGQVCRSCSLIKLSRFTDGGRLPEVLFRWKELEAFFGDREEWNNKTPSCPPKEVGKRMRWRRMVWELA